MAKKRLCQILKNTIKRILGKAVPKPKLVRLVITKENGIMLEFKLVLPVPGAVDVVGRELTVKVADGEAVTQTVAADVLEVAGFSGADNAAVEVSLVDVDDAGNKSEARVQTFTLVDNLAPPVPGEIGLQVTNEA